jgi:hypothetical protein
VADKAEVHFGEVDQPAVAEVLLHERRCYGPDARRARPYEILSPKPLNPKTLNETKRNETQY